MTPHPALATLLASAHLCCSCGSPVDDDGPASGGTHAGGAAGAAGAGATCHDGPAAAVDDVSGTWALLQVETSIVASSFMADFHTEVVSVLRLQQTQTGSDVTAVGTWCDRFAYEPDATVRSSMPPNFASLLPNFTWTGTHVQDAGGGGATTWIPCSGCRERR